MDGEAVRQPGRLVCVDADQARAAQAQGASVVVVAADPERLAAMLAGLSGGSPGRAAGFVGDPTDPEVMTAARIMADELFARTEGPIVMQTKA